MVSRVDGNLIVSGDLSVGGSMPEVTRARVVQTQLASYLLPYSTWYVHDAVGTIIGTAGNDDLGVAGDTFGTDVPYITAGDQKNNTSLNTRYARTVFQLPPEYDTGQDVQIRASAGMVTTVASAAATIDFEVYKSDRETAKSGSDLCATAAQSINSTTFADKDFVITATSLAPGDWLDIRMAIGVNDTGTGTAVDAAAGSVEMLLDIRG